MKRQDIDARRKKFLRCMHPGCDEAAEKRGLCNRHMNIFRTRGRLAAKRENHLWPHHGQGVAAVYVIGAFEMEPVKIGRAKNPVRRLAEMQVGSPYTLRLFHAFYGRSDVVEVLELEAHEILRDLGFHVRGEWFDCTPDEAASVVKKCAEIADLHVYDPQEIKAKLEQFYEIGTRDISRAHDTITSAQSAMLATRMAATLDLEQNPDYKNS
jgi:hypothetical protein